MNGKCLVGLLLLGIAVGGSSANATQRSAQAQFFTITPEEPDDLWKQIEKAVRESIESSLLGLDMTWRPPRTIPYTELARPYDRFAKASSFAEAIKAASESGVVFLYTDLETYGELLKLRSLRTKLHAPGLEIIAPRLVGIPLFLIENHANPIGAAKNPRIAFAFREEYPVQEYELRALLRESVEVETSELEQVQNPRTLAEKLYGQELNGGKLPVDRRVDLVVIAEQEPLILVDEFLEAFAELLGDTGGLNFVGPPQGSAIQQKLVGSEADLLSHVWLRGEPHLDRGVVEPLPAYELLFTPGHRRTEAREIGYPVILSNITSIDDVSLSKGFGEVSGSLSDLTFLLPYDLYAAVAKDLRSTMYTSFLLAAHRDDLRDELKTLSLLFHHQLMKAQYSREYAGVWRSLFGWGGGGDIAAQERQTDRVNSIRKELANDCYLNADGDGLKGDFVKWLQGLASHPVEFSNADVENAKTSKRISVKRLLYSCDSSVLLYGQGVKYVDDAVAASKSNVRMTLLANAALKFLAAMQEGPEPRPLTKGCSMRGRQLYNPYYQFARVVFLMEAEASSEPPAPPRAAERTAKR